MAGRVTSLGDVAAAMIAVATAPTDAGPRVMRLRLVIPMLARSVPEGAALWTTVLRHAAPRAAPVDWLARWRRARRRRAGWAPIAIELHWTARGVVARAEGRRIALFPASQGSPS